MKTKPELLSLAEIATKIAALPYNQQLALARWNTLKLLQRAARLSPDVQRKRQRLANCNRAFINDVTIVQKGNRRSMKGLNSCGAKFCPRCQSKLAFENLKRIHQVLELSKKEYPRGGQVLATLTVSRPMRLSLSHDSVALWNENYMLIDTAWAYFSSAYTSDLRKDLGWWNHIKKVEEMYACGKEVSGTWIGGSLHCHLHIIGLLESVDAYGLDELKVSEYLFHRWEASVRYAVKKLRGEKKAALSWIDLRKKSIVAPPRREPSNESKSGFVIRGGVNVIFPEDVNSAGAYLEKLAGELSLSIYKEGQGSFPPYALPLLYGTKLHAFAQKALEFHVIASKGVHHLEFGRVRIDGRNCGVDRYLREQHGRPASNPEPPVHEKALFLMSGKRFNREIMKDENTHLEFTSRISSETTNRQFEEESIFLPILDKEIAQEILDSQNSQVKQMVAKSLLARGMIDHELVFKWIFQESEEMRESYRRRKAGKLQIIESKADTSFIKIWGDIKPKKLKTKSQGSTRETGKRKSKKKGKKS